MVTAYRKQAHLVCTSLPRQLHIWHDCAVQRAFMNELNHLTDSNAWGKDRQVEFCLYHLTLKIQKIEVFQPCLSTRRLAFSPKDAERTPVTPELPEHSTCSAGVKWKTLHALT